jgi:hypothetical protein
LAWGSGQFESVRHDLEHVLALPQFNTFGLVTLPFSSPSLNEPLEIKRSFVDQRALPINWERMSGTLTGHRGGGEDAVRVVSKLKEWCIYALGDLIWNLTILFNLRDGFVHEPLTHEALWA